MMRAMAMLMVLRACGPALAGEAYDAANPPDCPKPVFPADPEILGAPQAFIKDYVDTQSMIANRRVNVANAAVEEANAFIADSRARLSSLP